MTALVRALGDVIKDGCPFRAAFDIHLFQIPFDAIRAIYIGARASAETKERIVSAVNTRPAMNRVVIYQMRISDDMFELHADRIILPSAPSD